MPYSYQLTWMPHAKRWRKRYLGITYYLRTANNGKRDRQGYEATLCEWERLKSYIDGLGPNPYTHTGTLIPESQVVNATPLYVPPAVAQTELPTSGNGHSDRATSARQPRISKETTPKKTHTKTRKSIPLELRAKTKPKRPPGPIIGQRDRAAVSLIAGLLSGPATMATSQPSDTHCPTA